ncbi:MAG: pyridinium-3,5-bisthiocarboxylic acid mononucleotide nickel chelatase, partial [Candidatus Atribacteria bacterium]|nr:pyridinium-3,5-bisthiocarboxylic acid mononucleotide nickel chelatase [Candidatus Atribacteria bacterium]
MSKFLYLDCFSGISGDMFLSSLLDLGISSSLFISEIKKMPIPFEIEIKKVQKHNISATQIKIKEEEHQHHHHRPARELIRIIRESPFTPSIKEKAQEMVRKIAEVEAKIHGADPQEIHLHEVGGVDTLVDITGVLIALHMLEIDEICSSPIPTGHGWVESAHGLLPIPAPATLELLRGIPIYSGEVEGELTTPTGAVLVSTLSKSFGSLPSCQIEKIGYGAGERDYSYPNVLRAIIGKKEVHLKEEKNLVIETNIDDMSPQIVEYLTEKLFQEGALDVFITPIFMKKQRPAFQLSVITPLFLKTKMEEVILKET